MHSVYLRQWKPKVSKEKEILNLAAWQFWQWLKKNAFNHRYIWHCKFSFSSSYFKFCFSWPELADVTRILSDFDVSLDCSTVNKSMLRYKFWNDQKQLNPPPWHVWRRTTVTRRLARKQMAEIHSYDHHYNLFLHHK